MVLHNYIYTTLIILFLFLISVRAQTWDDAFRELGISWNSDGTLNRSQVPVPIVPPTQSADGITPPPTTLSKDILHPNGELRFRLYTPTNPPTSEKLPLIINVHGGNFILCSAASAPYHDFCNGLAAQIPAVVVSVEHPLAPEHRLPDPYHYIVSAVTWAYGQALAGNPDRDPWMENVNFSRTFLLGSSSGANMVFHAMIRILRSGFDYSQVDIRALILNQPYFGGEERTSSELQLEHDEHFPLYMNDMFWKLALPDDSTRDHVFCNPISGGLYGGFLYELPEVFIKMDRGDPLFDRDYMFWRHLYYNNVNAIFSIHQGYHGIELVNSTAAQFFYDRLRLYINGSDRPIRLPKARS